METATAGDGWFTLHAIDYLHAPSLYVCADGVDVDRSLDADALHQAALKAERTLGVPKGKVLWKKHRGGRRRRAQSRFMVARCRARPFYFIHLTRRLHLCVLEPSLSPPHAATVVVVGPA